MVSIQYRILTPRYCFQSDLNKGKNALDAQLVQKQAELAALQQQLRETSGESPILTPPAGTQLLSTLSSLTAERANLMAQATLPVLTPPSPQARAAQDCSHAADDPIATHPMEEAVPGVVPTGAKKRAKSSATVREREAENERAAPKPPKTRAGSSKKRRW